MIKKLELTHENHKILAKHCQNLKIDFISTPYDIDSARFLHEELDVHLFKTASADLVDLTLHKWIAKTGKPCIMSVGMATLGEIEETVNIYKELNNNNIILLHCVSNYPCSDESINLKVLGTLKHAFQCPVGYSDHSIGYEAAVLSLAYNACIIEKHFTLDKNLPGPDHKASSTPDEFKQLAIAIRRSEKMIGNPIKQCQQEEIQMSHVSRKSIMSSRGIKAGEVFEYSNLTLKRPGTGLSSKYLNHFIGKKATIDLPAHTCIKFSHAS